MPKTCTRFVIFIAMLGVFLASASVSFAYLGTNFWVLQDMPHRYRWNNANATNATTMSAPGYNMNASQEFMIMVQPSWLLPADFRKSQGGFGIIRSTGTFWYDIFSLQYENEQYYWHDVEDLPIGDRQSDPWNSLQTISLGANFLDTWVENYNFKAGVTLDSSFESSMDDSFGGSIWGQVKGSFLDGWLLPLAWARYIGIHPESGFMLGNLDIGVNIEVPGPRFVKFLADEGVIDKDSSSDFSMDLMFYSRTRFYRLSNTSTVQERGYLQTNELTVSFIASYKPDENWEIRLMPEYIFNRNMKIFNNSGTFENKYKVNDTMGLTLSLGYVF